MGRKRRNGDRMQEKSIMIGKHYDTYFLDPKFSLLS